MQVTVPSPTAAFTAQPKPLLGQASAAPPDVAAELTLGAPPLAVSAAEVEEVRFRYFRGSQKS